MNKKEKSDVKFSEKFSIKFRKIIIVSKLFTMLTVLILVSAFIGLNVWIQSLELPEIDVTANKIYTLSDSSKVALQDIDQDVKIYIFGIEEDDSVVGLIKQYCNANDKISYEMLSNDTNLEKVQEFELEDGYKIVVVESGDTHKIIDASSEFKTYDYSTSAEVDTTEQTLTNSILSLSTKNKPKVYFVEGHQELAIAKEDSSAQAELGVLTTYLNNEAYEVNSLDLSTTTAIPEDCDVLAIMSPVTDYLENESQEVIDYINKGGNIFLTKDIESQQNDLTNFNKILAEYGVTIDSGYIVETDSKYTNPNSPNIFKPQLSSSNKITSDIASDSYMWLAFAQKLSFTDDLESLHVTQEPLIETTETAKFVTDLTTDVNTASATAETGKYTIASLVTKTISEATTDEETGDTKDDAVTSKLIVCGNGVFISDYVVSGLSNSYPISYLGSNKDFAVNAISSLADNEKGLTIRKDMAGTSYVFSATKQQNAIVLLVIFVVPILILIIGIIVGKLRKRRK